ESLLDDAEEDSGAFVGEEGGFGGDGGFGHVGRFRGLIRAGDGAVRRVGGLIGKGTGGRLRARS
ncbi:MAG TPA: hypothetical protein PLP91_10215, partial [Plasticicumulans sp.]|nr:hypothetical protein [Plasticicumulans sp.]